MEFTVWALHNDGKAEAVVSSADVDVIGETLDNLRAAGFGHTAVVAVPTFVDLSTHRPQEFRYLAARVPNPAR